MEYRTLRDTSSLPDCELLVLVFKVGVGYKACYFFFDLSKLDLRGRATIRLMKTLYILRHAKSSWKFPELKDFERPLSARGTQEVPMMGERFRKNGRMPGCIITSPAVRAKTTAHLFADAIGYPVDDISSNPELYFAGKGMFLKAASLVDEEHESAMLVGHNPAITEFVNAMTGSNINNVFTCGLVEMQLPIDNWSDITMGNARLIDFDYPKRVHQ